MSRLRYTLDDIEHMSLEKLIPLVETWIARRDENTQSLVFIPKSESFGLVDRLVPLDEFNALDARFGALLMHLSDAGRQPRIDGEEIWNAVEGWLGDFVTLPSIYLSTRHTAHAVSEQVTVKALSSLLLQDDGDVWVKAKIYTPQCLPDGTAYAGAELTDRFYLPAAWVAENITGWEERWQAGQALELAASQLAKFVLGSNHVTPESLQSVLAPLTYYPSGD